MKKLLTACIALMSVARSAPANTIDQQMGWLAWFNTHKLTEHWGYVSDVQLRSSDDWKDAQTLLVRPGVTYYLDKQNNLTLGYANVTTLNNPGDNLVEHRIWQQYIHTGTWSTAAFTHRVRLEQRFVERQQSTDRVFSQRLRYFVRAVVPISGEQKTFERGPFIALQNELFFNVQHKNNANDKLFDQNRLLLAGGYRLSSRIDLELGYFNQFIQARRGSDDTMNHIVQLGVYTRF